jgi:hypothetical protein
MTPDRSSLGILLVQGMLFWALWNNVHLNNKYSNTTNNFKILKILKKSRNISQKSKIFKKQNILHKIDSDKPHFTSLKVCYFGHFGIMFISTIVTQQTTNNLKIL